MALTSTELTQTLREMVERRKSYRDHPWIQRYLKGELSRAQIRTWIEHGRGRARHLWADLCRLFRSAGAGADVGKPLGRRDG